MDKLEIEREARKIGIWSEKHAGCCTVVPRYPSTSAKTETVERLFAKIGLEKEIENELGNVVEIRSFKDVEKFQNSLRKES